MAKTENSIIENYKGVNVRSVNIVKLRLDPVRFKKLLDEVDRTGLPIPKILAYSGKPCERCKDVCVVIYGKEGELIHIKRGMLHVAESNGNSIIDKAKNRCSKP
jgi:hypothetical protein